MKIDRCFHSIILPDGTVTPGDKPFSVLEAEEQAVFELVDVQGKSVLDVGAWDGYFSFAAERRGASRVTASDWFCWDGPGWGTKSVFEHVRNELGSSVEDWDVAAEDLPLHGAQWDVVLMLGVIYHVMNPIDLITRAASRARECVILETHFEDDGRDEPLLYLIPDDRLNNDPTNWTAPNLTGLAAMCEMAGLTNVKLLPHPLFPTVRVFVRGDVA